MDSEKLVKCGLGIDIAKDVCYACAMPENKMFTYQNTPEGIKKFVSEIKKVKPDQIVLEPIASTAEQRFTLCWRRVFTSS